MQKHRLEETILTFIFSPVGRALDAVMTGIEILVYFLFAEFMQLCQAGVLASRLMEPQSITEPELLLHLLLIILPLPVCAGVLRQVVIREYPWEKGGWLPGVESRKIKDVALSLAIHMIGWALDIVAIAAIVLLAEILQACLIMRFVWIFKDLGGVLLLAILPLPAYICILLHFAIGGSPSRRLKGLARLGRRNTGRRK